MPSRLVEVDGSVPTGRGARGRSPVSQVEATPHHGEARVISRRRFLMLAGSTSSLVLLVACQRASAPPSPPEATQAPLAARTMAPVSQPTAAPAAAKPELTAAPAVSRGEPRGRFTEAFNASIPPAWLDPQENPPQVTPYNFDYALHDALVKHMPGKEFAPSLAESYDIAPDYKSATFKLRPGIKFHDGSKVTPEDVKFTYENYRGASAPILKAKLDRIDLPDDRTVKFFFKEPFLDFLMLYGSPASGAGWIVPKAYYEKVGKDLFKQAPIGAGPYRFVRQQAGVEVELEAFTDYWRKDPRVKTIIFKGIPETASRVALAKTGEVDASVSIEGELLESLKRDPGVRLTATKSGTRWLELMALDRPDHPLKDIRVRQAVSLAIDRQAINEAGVGDGFDVSLLTPLPPFFLLGRTGDHPAADGQHQDAAQHHGAGGVLRKAGPRPESAEGPGPSVLGWAGRRGLPASGERGLQRDVLGPVPTGDRRPHEGLRRLDRPSGSQEAARRGPGLPAGPVHLRHASSGRDGHCLRPARGQQAGRHQRRDSAVHLGRSLRGHPGQGRLIVTQISGPAL